MPLVLKGRESVWVPARGGDSRILTLLEESVTFLVQLVRAGSGELRTPFPVTHGAGDCFFTVSTVSQVKETGRLHVTFPGCCVQLRQLKPKP
ncbi:hypothetical protein TREES_T100015637 [Tupaia chinensis]|uniref:Uncharacterized protein n=1 Tax=Tupaia chinensis TaxID=246437 RepID=L9L877_TUPCH|nr:hypothetical protein TREES_T100015637 [Tupaia chinensis]